MASQNSELDMPIIFIGSMNAMPMMYAIELKRKGHKVIYVVDVSRAETLSRPEFHFSEISYPYPDWIIEFPLKSQLIPALFPHIFLASLKKKIAQRCINFESALVITNGFHHSLIKYLPSSTKTIALSYGADFDVWADIDAISTLAKNLSNRSIFKFLPRFLTNRLISHIVKNQRDNLNRADALIYFAKGLNSVGDKVLSQLECKQVFYRHDVSFLPIQKAVRKSTYLTNNKLILIAPVRFLFKTFPDGNLGYNKGNDRILKGVAEFKTHNIPFELHLVEKGEDVEFAKDMIEELNLTDNVIWHKEMPFTELLKLYEIADVCFDQVGDHWVGAVGIYALFMGIPLIANSKNLIDAKIIEEPNLICNASSAHEVCTQLLLLSQEHNYQAISKKLRKFSEDNFGPDRIISKITEMTKN